MIQPTGYYRIHRELFHKPIWLQSTAEQKVVLMALIAMAWFKPNEWEWEGKKFSVGKGQFVTSLDSIVRDCGKGISVQNVRSSLKRFEKLGFLTNRSTKQGRLVTLVNWELYQLSDDNPTKQTTKTQQRPNKAPTPKEEGNKELKKKTYSENTILSDTIYDFIAMRKSIKKPMTDRAITLMLSKLKKLSNEEDIQIKILEESIMNNWNGIFPLKQAPKQSPNNFNAGITVVSGLKKREAI